MTKTFHQHFWRIVFSCHRKLINGIYQSCNLEVYAQKQFASDSETPRTPLLFIRIFNKCFSHTKEDVIAFKGVKISFVVTFLTNLPWNCEVRLTHQHPYKAELFARLKGHQSVLTRLKYSAQCWNHFEESPKTLSAYFCCSKFVSHLTLLLFFSLTDSSRMTDQKFTRQEKYKIISQLTLTAVTLVARLNKCRASSAINTKSVTQ